MYYIVLLVVIKYVQACGLTVNPRKYKPTHTPTVAQLGGRLGSMGPSLRFLRRLNIFKPRHL